MADSVPVKILRDRHGRLLPGSVMNPRGRPRTGLALAEAIREVAGDPATLRELIRLALDVAFGRAVCIDAEWQRQCGEARRKGEPLPPRPDKGEVIQPNMSQIQAAWEFLGTWGFRRPPQEVEVASTGNEGEPRADYGRLSEAELDALEALHRKAAGILDVGGG